MMRDDLQKGYRGDSEKREKVELQEQKSFDESNTNAVYGHHISQG